MKLLNLGCGSHYHPEWTNCDNTHTDKNVLKVDVRRPLPFQNGEFDMVYSSHLLEHLNKNEAYLFLKECRRVLKKGGIIRIVVPDFEEIAKQYLYYLSRLKKGEKKYEGKYFWILLELFDQMVREKPGGEMLIALRDSKIDKKFVLERIGYEAESYWDKINENDKFIQKLFRARRLMTLKNFHNLLILSVCYLLGGKKAAQNYFLGFFRNAGEIHKYMYDEYLLSKILKDGGFTNVKRFGALSSNLKEFKKYNLDEINGKVRKPDSFFMEAIKK